MASVRGQARRLHLWVPFAAGGLLGGATTGLVLAVLSGLLSPVPEWLRLAIAAIAAVALTMLDLVQRRLRLPQRSRLIPQSVFAQGIARGIFRFGFEYGTGVRTLIPSAASVILAVALVLIGLPWWQTVLVAAVFGAARALAVLQFLLLGSEGWAEFLSSHTRSLERTGSVVTALLVAAVVLGA
ncbi:MAG: hypothetical protein WCA30_17060 [Dermatophilaceae bacterium]